MYKLKNSYIDSMINCRLSSREIDFLLHIALYQDEAGRVESVYYRDVCSEIGISVQKFYDILKRLAEYGLIITEKCSYSDIRVQLVGNDFSKESYKKGSEGYINVALNDFKKDKFYEMKAGSKLLYLYTQRFINGKHMFVAKFYEDFCELLKCSKKSLQEYVHELKERSYLFISRKRNRAYNYEMTMKRSTVLYRKDIVKSENEMYRDNLISHLKANFKKYIPPDDAGEDALYGIAKLTAAKRAKRHNNFYSLVVEAVESSINLQKREKKPDIVLNAALVNQCLSNILDRQIMSQYKMA